MLPNIHVVCQGSFFKIKCFVSYLLWLFKNVDIMQKVRYQHHNSICESMINRPDD